MALVATVDFLRTCLRDERISVFMGESILHSSPVEELKSSVSRKISLFFNFSVRKVHYTKQGNVQ